MDSLPSDQLAKYDLVMSTGCISKGHIPPQGFEDAHALLKTGGHFVTCIRKLYYEPDSEYRQKLDELIAAGKLQIVKTWEFTRGMD